MLLNGTAAWIYERRDGADLAGEYSAYFGVSLEVAAVDVERTLGALAELESGRRMDDALPDGCARTIVCSLMVRIEQTVCRIDLESEALVAELVPRVEGLEVSGAAIPEHVFRLYEAGGAAHVEKDGRPFASEALVTGARAQLLQELTRVAVAGRDFSAVLHAGAVGNGDGCVILAGASFAGKSTLCRAMMRAGWVCYSDDSACLTREWRVAGMPFALAMRDGPRWVESNLGGGSPECLVKALVFVEYRAGVVGVEVVELNVFEALVGLQGSGFWVGHSLEGIGGFLAWLGGIRRYRVVFGEGLAGVAWISEMMGRERGCGLR